MTFVPETDHGVVVADVSTPSANRMEDSLQRINDAVYLAKKSVDEGRRGAQIVFIHGLQVQKNKDPFLETWLSADGRDLWPKSWLSDSFPTSEIYLVRYDSSTWKDDPKGRLDMFVTAENLLHNLLQAKIGQNPRYPVILIGHDVGGLLTKEICLQAFLERSSASKERMAHEKRLFLDQLKGVFYLSTPHGGLHHWDRACQGDLMRALMVHNEATSRSNENFRKMRAEFKWRASGLGASLPGKDEVLHVNEASGRYDVDEYTMIGTASTMDICRPKDRKSSTFLFLEKFIRETFSGFKNCDRVKLPFRADLHYVPLIQTEREIRQRLEDPYIHDRVVVLYGDAGKGKTSFVKYLALQYEQEVETGWNSEFRDGIFYFECGRGANAIRVLRKMLRDLQEDENVISTYYEDQNLMSNSARKRLRNLNALMIFDDVWDEDRQEFVEKVVFPEAKQVKYLITSQQSDGWSGYSTCQIQTINYNIAKQIIAKHAGLRDDKIPEDCEDIVDVIIQATDLHPLALATVSNLVRLDAGESALRRAHWERLSEDLLVYLREDTLKRPSAFGELYPRSVFAAMMYAVDRLVRDKNGGSAQLHLMCIMALFESPFPTSLLHMFMLCTRPELSRGVHMLITRLRGYQLVEDAMAQPLVRREILTVPEVTIIELPHLMMHNLRQRFILSCVETEFGSSSTSSDSVQVIRRTLAPFLSETDDGGARDLEPPEGEFHPQALSTALCALYGVAQVKKEAIGRLCKYQLQAELKIPVWNIDFRSESEWSRHYCLEVLMAGIEKHGTLTDIQSALQKVVWKYIFELQIDYDELSVLISRGYDCALTFLVNYVSQLGLKERVALTSSSLRSLAVAVGWLKRFKGTNKDFNNRSLTVLSLFQRLACTVWGDLSDPTAVLDALDLEFLLYLLHREYEPDELSVPTVVIQILGSLADANQDLWLRWTSILRARPVLQEAIKSVMEKMVMDLNINWKSILTEISEHGNKFGKRFHKAMVQLDTVVVAVNLLRPFQTSEKVVATVGSISAFLEVVARSFQSDLADYLCVLGLITFRSIPCIKDQGGRSVIWSIPGAVEGVVSLVRRYRHPACISSGSVHHALEVLDFWTRSDDSIRSCLLSDQSFLDLLVEVIGDHRGEWHPLRQSSAVLILKTFVTSNEAASTSISVLASSPKLHQVLSELLVGPQRVLQRSALTVSDSTVASSCRSGWARLPEVHQIQPDLQVGDPPWVSQRSPLTVGYRKTDFLSGSYNVLPADEILLAMGRDLQTSVLTVLLYLGYSIPVENYSNHQFVTSKHPQGGVDDHGVKVSNAFESLFGVILNNEARVAQVAALELLVYLVRHHSSARARIYAMPSAVTGQLATLLHQDEAPAVQELALQTILNLAVFEVDDWNSIPNHCPGFIRRIADSPDVLEKIMEFMGYDWVGRKYATVFLILYSGFYPESASRILAVPNVLRNMVVSLQDKHQDIAKIEDTVRFLWMVCGIKRSKNFSSFLSIEGSIEAVVELLAHCGHTLEQSGPLIPPSTKNGENQRKKLLCTMENCFKLLSRAICAEGAPAMSRIVATGRVFDVMVDLLDMKQPERVQLYSVMTLTSLSHRNPVGVIQTMKRPDFIEKFSLLLQNPCHDREERKWNALMLPCYLIMDGRNAIPKEIVRLVSCALQDSFDQLTDANGAQVPRVVSSLRFMLTIWPKSINFIVKAAGVWESLLSLSLHHPQPLTRAQALRVLCLCSGPLLLDRVFTPCLRKVLDAFPRLVDLLESDDVYTVGIPIETNEGERIIALGADVAGTFFFVPFLSDFPYSLQKDKANDPFEIPDGFEPAAWIPGTMIRASIGAWQISVTNGRPLVHLLTSLGEASLRHDNFPTSHLLEMKCLIRTKVSSLVLHYPQVLQHLTELLKGHDPLRDKIMVLLYSTAWRKNVSLRIVQIPGTLETISGLLFTSDAAFLFVHHLVSNVWSEPQECAPRYLVNALVNLVAIHKEDKVPALSFALDLLGKCALQNKKPLHYLINMLNKRIKRTLRVEAMNYLLNHGSDTPKLGRKPLPILQRLHLSMIDDLTRDHYLGPAPDLQMQVIRVLVCLIEKSPYSQLRIAKYVTGISAHDLQISDRRLMHY